MKVAVVFDNFGPYHRARLRAASCACEVVGIQVAARSSDYSWNGGTDAEGFRMVTVLDRGKSRDLSARNLARRLEQTLTREQPDVVCGPGWSGRAAFAASRWCGKRRVPAVVMSESTAWDADRRPWRESLKRRYLRLFGAALAGGHPQQDYLVELGFQPDRVFLGYDAVENQYFTREQRVRSARCEEVRRRLALPPLYFLTSARCVEKKNLARLLEAFAAYRRRRISTAEGAGSSPTAHGTRTGSGREPWDLVILGDGPLRPDLERQCRERGIEAWVHWPGFRQYPELPDYYTCAGAFVLPSTIEPWGLVVNEALASGLPVLVSQRCGCARDLVREGLNGFTFDPWNVEQLSERLELVSSIPADQRAAMGVAGRRLVSEWGPDRFASGLCAAAAAAQRVGPRVPGLLDRVLLGVLSRYGG